MKYITPNSLTDLRRLLGLTSEHKEGVRRERKATNGKTPARHYSKTVNTALADQLQLSGVAVLGYQDRVEYLEGQVSDLKDDLSLTAEIAERSFRQLEEAEKPQCWFCKLKRWWKG